MKFVKRISIFFLYPCVCFCAGALCMKAYQTFYPSSVDKLNTNVSINNESLLLSEKTEPATMIPDETITADTEYIVYEYDMEFKTKEAVEASIPAKYIGMTRTEFLDELQVYEKSPSLADLKKGFVSIDVLAFSKNKIEVQKNYIYEPEELHFYVLVENHYLSVYYDDLYTLFIKTDILLEELPEEMQLEIIQGKYFETEEELYNFLESYSS